MMYRRTVAWAGGFLLAFTACTGQVGSGSAPAPGTGGAGASMMGGSPAPTGPATDPGRVTLHRLNRVEYNNTVRDLLGTTLRPADEFPSDDRGYGFDNIADVLSLSPLHIELLQRSAQAVVDDALRPGVDVTTTRFEAETVGSPIGQAYKQAWLLWSNGELVATFKAPADGTYKLRARAWAQQAGAELAKLSLGVDAATKVFDVKANEVMPEIVESTFKVVAGNRTVRVGFTNDFVDTATSADRNLFVDYFEIEGPLEGPTRNPSRDRLLTCDPASGEACVDTLLRAFMRRAWRRPVTADEMARLMGVVRMVRADGQSFESGLKLALQSALVSPHFVFRVELDPTPTSLVPHKLNPHEFASRLSYFLWSSMPDDALFAAADAGRLSTPAEIKAQVARMLADAKAAALIANFGGQWLYTRKLDDHDPDANVFPSYNPALREDMRDETQLMFRDFVAGDIGIDKMLASDTTYLTDRLAKHYGLPPPGSAVPKKVSVAGTNRGGFLTQGSLLTVTSYPTRTSPVQRGRWILEQLLCIPPPPPPPGVEGLKPEDKPTGTLRERLELHRANVVCASCHALMDPLGFGLENYDAVGVYRSTDAGKTIDASGKFPDGRAFNGAKQLSTVLAADPRFAACVTEQLYVYALGRGVEHTAGHLDTQTVDGLAKGFLSGGLRLRTLLESVATSGTFAQRRGELEPMRTP